jgi:hypothetical protein
LEWLFLLYCRFQLSGANGTALYFGYGGYQEARGSSIHNNHFYVENIKEELDAPGEWFYDTSTSELLFWPNSTTATLVPTTPVAAVSFNSSLCLIDLESLDRFRII